MDSLLDMDIKRILIKMDEELADKKGEQKEQRELKLKWMKFLISQYNDMQYQVEAIIGRRFMAFRNRLEYLIKWKNYPVQESTWEPAENLKNSQLLVWKYELQRLGPKKAIQVVEQDPEKEKDKKKDDQSLYDRKEPEQKRSKKNQKTKQIIKSKEDKKEKVKKPQSQKSIQKNQRKEQVIIYKNVSKNGKMYFKIIEKGQKFWRNRNYLVEFYPEELCRYYEKLLLKKHL